MGYWYASNNGRMFGRLSITMSFMQPVQSVHREFFLVNASTGVPSGFRYSS